VTATAPKLRDNANDFRALIARTAERLDLPPHFVEKDYWTTELLRGATTVLDDGYLVFKGGTSLSKVHRIIQRLSEDVDLLLIVTREKSPSFGKGGVDRMLKEVTESAARSLGLTGHLFESTTGVKRNTGFTYPAFYTSPDTRPEVKLELGTRGGDDPPSTSHEVRSFIAEASDDVGPDEFEEMTPFEVRVLAPERTLLEKLSLVHDLASRFPEEQDKLGRAGRHFYDIYRLLDNAPILEQLDALDIVKLCADIREIAVQGFHGEPAGRPSEGFASSPAFNSEADCSDEIAAAYDDIDYLLLEVKPPLSKVRDKVRDCADLL
jgi:hypothetical protein